MLKLAAAFGTPLFTAIGILVSLAWWATTFVIVLAYDRRQKVVSDAAVVSPDDNPSGT